MSTYINGVTDYIPQIQEFKPDFNLYSKSLQLSQSKYDANHARLSNLYGSLLNAPMLRDENIKERDQFFKTIDQDIKKISGMDLSKQQNVEAASAIFNQLHDNKNIIKDMVWTKNWQNEHQRAESFRNCIDPEKCGGSWWEGGITALNYKASEFKNATAEQAMQMGNARYVPYQDVMKQAVALAKEADLNISVDQITGGYIVTTKNGPNIKKPLASLFLGTLGKDPKIMDYYRTKAYVDRKNWIRSNTPAYGSEEAASNHYAEQVMKTFMNQTVNTAEDLKATKENLATERKALEKKIREKGTTEDSSLAEVYREMINMEGAVDASETVAKEARGNLDVVMNNNFSEATLQNLDNVIASAYLKADISNAVETLQYRGFEQSYKEDPYAMENVRQANRLALENVRHRNKMQLEKYKIELEDTHAKRGDASANIPLQRDITQGGADINLDPQARYDDFVKNITKLEEEISAPEKSILIEAMKLTQEKSRTSNGVANEDLVDMMDAIIREFSDAGNYESRSGDLTTPSTKSLDAWNKMSAEQRLKYARNYDFNKLNNLNGVIIDDIYNKKLLPLFDMSINKANLETRGYLKHLWESTANKRMDIKSKTSYLDNVNKWYASETKNVKELILSDSEFEPYAAIIDIMVDDNGNIKKDVDFATAVAEKTVLNLPAGSNKELAYQQAYDNAIDYYHQEAPSGWAKSMVGLVHNMPLHEDVRDKFKEAWSKYAKPEGIPGILGSKSGSLAAEKMNIFPKVDPAESLSVGTMATTSFLRDIMQANPSDYNIRIGNADLNAEEKMAILSQIHTDLTTRVSFKDNKRPIINMTYQQILGGDSDWTGMNLKLDDAYVMQYYGSSKKKGIFYDKSDVLKETGISIALKKDAATNLLYKKLENTSLDNVLAYNGHVDIDVYPEIAENLKITRKGNNGLSLTGSVLTGFDKETGKGIWSPVAKEYNSPNANPNYIYADMVNYLGNTVAPSVKTLYDKFLQSRTGVIINSPEQLK